MGDFDVEIAPFVPCWIASWSQNRGVYGWIINGGYQGPVKFTRPYFDCGRSNTWKVAAVVPIVDIYPRHTQFRHIEYPVYTAVAVTEMDFERIDINQCPKGKGNFQ